MRYRDDFDEQENAPDGAAESEPEAKADDIERSGGITTHNSGGNIHALIIAGQIEGHYTASPQTKSTKYEQCIPTLVAVEESDEINLGDINNDSIVDVLDANLVVSFIAGKVQLTAAQEAAADADGSGAVDLNDAALIVAVAYGKK